MVREHGNNKRAMMKKKKWKPYVFRVGHVMVSMFVIWPPINFEKLNFLCFNNNAMPWCQSKLLVFSSQSQISAVTKWGSWYTQINRVCTEWLHSLHCTKLVFPSPFYSLSAPLNSQNWFFLYPIVTVFQNCQPSVKHLKQHYSLWIH